MKPVKTVLPRRQFLQERLSSGIAQLLQPESSPPKVVSSLILQVRPESLSSVCSVVAEYPGAEVHDHDGNSKAVIVLETDSNAELSGFMSMAAEIPGVINVCMVFHHTDMSTNLFPAE